MNKTDWISVARIIKNKKIIYREGRYLLTDCEGGDGQFVFDTSQLNESGERHLPRVIII